MKRDYHVDIHLSRNETNDGISLSFEAKGLRDDEFLDEVISAFRSAAEKDKNIGFFMIQMGVASLIRYVQNGTVKGDELDELLSTLYELIDDKNEVMKELRRNGRQE